MPPKPTSNIKKIFFYASPVMLTVLVLCVMYVFGFRSTNDVMLPILGLLVFIDLALKMLVHGGRVIIMWLIEFAFVAAFWMWFLHQ